MQQLIPNPEDIIDPTTTMNMSLVLMAKAFKLNYSTPTNNKNRISSNPYNRQIAQPGMNMGQDRQMRRLELNGGNQCRVCWGMLGIKYEYNAVQIVGNQDCSDAVQNQVFRILGMEIGMGHLARNCIVRPRRRVLFLFSSVVDLLKRKKQAFKLKGRQAFDIGGAVYEYSKPTPEPHHEYNSKMDNVISDISSWEQEGGTLSTEKSTVSSLLEEKKKLKSDFKIREDELLDKQIQLENKIKELDNILCYQEIHKILKEEIFPIINQVDSRLQNFEIQFLKEAAKFVRDFKSLAKEADESLAKHIENGIGK
ncbi:hypothetical protein Tco_1272365 [Tanacetum coccineum]